MAGEGKSNATDTLSADLKALQDRVEKLTDKLNDTQREVVQLRAEMGGQDKRLSDTVGRIGDVNTWLGGFAIVVTLIISVAGVFTYLQAGKRAADEARQWISQNTQTLSGQIEVLEQEASKLKDRMALIEGGVKKHADEANGRLDEIVRQAISKEKNISLGGGLLGGGDNKKIAASGGDNSVGYLFRVGKSAYDNGDYGNALEYFSEIIVRSDATPLDVASALQDKARTFWKMGRPDDEIAMYDDVIKRFYDSEDVFMHRIVSNSMYLKGLTQILSGKSADARLTFTSVIEKYSSSNDYHVLYDVANTLKIRAYNNFLGGDDRAFLADTERALVIWPNDAELLSYRAFAWYLLGKPRSQVVAAYAQAWEAMKDPQKWNRDVVGQFTQITSFRSNAQVPRDLIEAVAALAVKGK